MQFDHTLLHRPESLDLLDSRLKQPDLNLQQLVEVADDFVGHGHRDAPLAIERMRAAGGNSRLDGYGRYLEAAWKSLREDYQPENQPAEQLDEFYRLNGFVIVRPPVPSKKLLVLFTTMFNSFGISTAAAVSIIANTGVNILVLKDSTFNFWGKGVAGLSSDFAGIATGIQSVADKLGADSIYISGFSSGGYAALLTSLMLPCRGYLGFSQWTDKSDNSPLLQSNSIFTVDQLADQNPQLRVNLRPLLEKANPNVPRTLIYGGQRPNDVAHARNLEGLNTIKVICRPKASHNVIVPLVSKKELEPVFRQLVSAA